MSDRYPISNQPKSNSITTPGEKLQRPPLKINQIGHSGSLRGVHTNVGPNQTGYDHMYATDTEDGQQQQQQVALSCANSRTETSGLDTATTIIPEDHHFLKDFLLIHLDIIQQQNEEILKKDNTIFQLQQENALLKHRLKSLEQHNSTSTHTSTLTTFIHKDAIPATTDSHLNHQEHQQTAPGDYSPESIPPTEDVVAPDVGDDMTLAEPVSPLTANNIVSSTITPFIPVKVVATVDEPQPQESIVASVSTLPQEVCVEPAQVQVLTGVVNCVLSDPSEVVIIEDDCTDAEVQVQEPVQQIETKLVERNNLVVERVEQTSSGDTVACPKSVPESISKHTVDTHIVTEHVQCTSNSSSLVCSTATSTIAAITPATTTARYSVVRSSVASDSGEPNTKNLRMSIRRKRLCSVSSQSNSENVIMVDGGRDGGETKGRDDSLANSRGNEGSRSKRKRLNGQILTFPQEYVTRVGEANIDVLRHQALAEEVIKAASLEVPHWRVKVYADSYHLEGTENLDDEVFLKRHARLENDERRRKRWDVQRIREQRLVEKLKQRQTKSHHLNSDNTHSKISTNGGADGHPDSLDGYDTPASLWPAPEYDLQYIELTDRLPVGAFGVPLPAIIPGEFVLPWVGSEKAPSASGGEVETPIGTPTEVMVQSNNGRKSAASCGRKSGRESGGGSSKRRSKR